MVQRFGLCPGSGFKGFKQASRYVVIPLVSLWLSTALPGCSWLSAGGADDVSAETPEAVTVQRFDGVKVTILTRSGVIGSGVRKRIPEFEALTGAQIQLDTVPYGQLYDTLQTDWSKPESNYDAAVISPQWLIDFIKQGYLDDLTDHVEADVALAWDDIAPFFRNALATHHNQIYGIPVDGDYLMAYYRTDLLEREGLQPPATWDEYLAIAQQFHGQDLNGDGTPDYGSCMAKEPGHLGYFMIGGIAASYLQSQGTAQGAFLDPDTLQPLVNNAAFARALEVYQQTLDYGGLNDATLGLIEARDIFIAGRCALMIDWGDIPTIAADAENSNVVDKVGVTITPGTTQVLDRATGTLVTCDKFTCPYAIEGINHAPYAANLGYTGVILAQGQPTTRDAAYAFLSYLSQPAQANADVADGTTGFNPYRISQFKDVVPWTETGMSPTAANNYLGAIGVTLNSPNMALDLKLPYGKRYQLEVLDPIVADFMANKISKEEAMERIEQGWETITNEVGREAQREHYRSSLGL